MKKNEPSAPNKLVLVTGGLGYVGSALVPHLAANGYRVRVYDTMLFGNHLEGTPNVEFVKGDIRDYDTLAQAVKGCGAVVHLAGIVTDALVDMNPGLARKINVQATTSLCRIAWAARVERFVYASSSSVYGTQPEGVFATEDMLPLPKVLGKPPWPLTEYALSKLAGENITLSFSATDGFCTTALRSATCCGPAPRMRLDTIVNTFSAQAYFKKRIEVHGGDQWRSNVHVRDAAKAYRLLLEAPAEKVNGRAFNLVRECATAIDIARAVADIIPAEIHVDETKKDIRHYRMSGDLLRETLGWAPQCSIAEAVADNLAWFRAGKITDMDADLYWNTKRMAQAMKEGF